MELEMEKKKNGSSILTSIGWITVVLITFNLIPPYLIFIPICMGVVLRRDYQEDKQGLTMIIFGIISGILGLLLGLYLTLNQII